MVGGGGEDGSVMRACIRHLGLTDHWMPLKTTISSILVWSLACTLAADAQFVHHAAEVWGWKCFEGGYGRGKG
jgi:hypothetical protein